MSDRTIVSLSGISDHEPIEAEPTALRRWPEGVTASVHAKMAAVRATTLRDARVSELLLRDLDRHLEVVEQRRVNVTELMPRRPSESRPFGGRLQHVAEQL